MPNPDDWKVAFNAAIAEAVENAVDEVVGTLSHEGSYDKSIVLSVIEKLQPDTDRITTLVIHRLEQLLNKGKVRRHGAKLCHASLPPQESSRKAYRPLESPEQLLRIKEESLLNQARTLAKNPDAKVTVSMEDDGWNKVWIQEEIEDEE